MEERLVLLSLKEFVARWYAEDFYSPTESDWEFAEIVVGTKNYIFKEGVIVDKYEFDDVFLAEEYERFMLDTENYEDIKQEIKELEDLING